MLASELSQNHCHLAYKVVNPTTPTAPCFVGNFFTFSESLTAYINDK